MSKEASEVPAEKLQTSGELIFTGIINQLALPASVNRIYRSQSMPKKHGSIEEKKRHVAAWHTSGLIRQQYCEKNKYTA